MSSILGANTAYPAGVPTLLPEGEGERSHDAIAGDTYSKGVIVFLDSANATSNLRAYKLPGLLGAERGPYKLVTKDKVAGVAKVVGIGTDAEGTAVAGGNITGGARLKPSVTTAGRLDEMAAGDNAGLYVADYVRKVKYSNSGDGNNAIGGAVAGDVIVIKMK
jgi:hypothetical protein